jgi:hypothetical protein
VLIATISACLGAHSALASGAELIDALGAPLHAYAGASHDDGLRTLVVNGARLRLRSGTTQDSIDRVLDLQSASCREHGAWLNPIVRTRSRDQGFIGCIVPPAGQNITDGLSALAKTHDLASLGELRVTWALQGDGATRYVSVASDGALELPNMFPSEGDAPGIDLTDLPRPPAARRLLSTWQEGAAPLLVSYQSALPLDELEQRYSSELGAARRIERHAPDGDDERYLLIRQGQDAHLAILAGDPTGTLISIIPFVGDATVPEVDR